MMIQQCVQSKDATMECATVKAARTFNRLDRSDVSGREQAGGVLTCWNQMTSLCSVCVCPLVEDEKVEPDGFFVC